MPNLSDGSIVEIAVVIAFLLILSIGELISDHVLPHIPFIGRWLDTLPLSESEVVMDGSLWKVA